MMCGTCMEMTAHLYTGDKWRCLRCVIIGQKAILDALANALVWVEGATVAQRDDDGGETIRHALSLVRAGQ
jgi:hypothetical protein